MWIGRIDQSTSAERCMDEDLRYQPRRGVVLVGTNRKASRMDSPALIIIGDKPCNLRLLRPEVCVSCPSPGTFDPFPVPLKTLKVTVLRLSWFRVGSRCSLPPTYDCWIWRICDSTDFTRFACVRGAISSLVKMRSMVCLMAALVTVSLISRDNCSAICATVIPLPTTF